MSSLTPAALTDTCCVRQHHQRGSASLRWQDLGAHLTLRRPSGRVNEGTWVAIRSQHLGKVVFFILHVVLGAGDGLCPIVQRPDQTSLDMGWVVGLEVQTAVGVIGEETTVVDMARHPRELLLKEAIHIQMTPAEEHLNRDTGLELPGCWVAALRRQDSTNRTGPTPTDRLCTNGDRRWCGAQA